MKLHLPLVLCKSLLSCIALVAGCTLSSGSLAFADDLVLGAGDELSIDYAAADSIPNLENGSLQLTGDTLLQLLNCGSGDGKTYTLATGISCLLDAEGNTISLDSTNNAISNYFDTTKPGTGFWAGAILQLADDGTLQFMTHDEVVKAAVTITSRQTTDVDYQYYTNVHFGDLTVSLSGGAIEGFSIALNNNGSVVFERNVATSFSNGVSGGAIEGFSITLNNNGSVIFEENEASSSYSMGGAIRGSDDIRLNNNDMVAISRNKVTSYSNSYAQGGAIYGYGDYITLSNNGRVEFKENSAACPSGIAGGGAIFGYADIILNNNGRVAFSGNFVSSSSYAEGGALYGGSYHNIIMNDNGIVVFCKNKSVGSIEAEGGAIYGDFSSNIILNKNGSVIFCENAAEGYGGGICGNGNIMLSGNAYIDFRGNSAFCGGAICGDEGFISLNDNDSVKFRENTAEWGSGGAICGLFSSSAITLSNNTRIDFCENKAQMGGAIFGGGGVILLNNGCVSFSRNEGGNAGAIYTTCNLSIRNNDSVLFERNAEISDGSYRLRSIYAGGYGDVISLSAAVEKSITFRDSIYIWSESTFKLNEQYEGQAQQGDIIFTGATTVDDLYTVKGNVAGTAEEIRLSRTTEVNTLTELYGGRLRVEEGAIYQGQGITAMEGSAATVRVQNATLSHSGYDLTFNAGTSLEVAGNSTIRGNVNLLADSLFKLEKAATLSLHETLEADAAELTVQGTALLAGSSTLNASLTLAEGATLDMMSLDAGAVTINGALTFGGQVEMGENLMAMLNEMRGWEESVTLFTGIENLVLPLVVTSGDSGRVWVGDVFSNLTGNESYYIDFKADVGDLLVVHVPEPTTTTLSLLALCALASRRRRR